MKVKELIEALQDLRPEAQEKDIVIVAAGGMAMDINGLIEFQEDAVIFAVEIAGKETT